MDQGQIEQRDGIRYFPFGGQSGLWSIGGMGFLYTPAPQPVAGRRHLPKRCFGSGCARSVATQRTVLGTLNLNIGTLNGTVLVRKRIIT